MAGYNTNVGTNQYPEYQATAYPDSTNGTRGTNSLGAQTNQIAQRPSSGASDPYAAILERSKQWNARPAPQSSTPPTYQDPADVTAHLRGRAVGSPPPSAPPGYGPASAPPSTPGDMYGGWNPPSGGWNTAQGPVTPGGNGLSSVALGTGYRPNDPNVTAGGNGLYSAQLRSPVDRGADVPPPPSRLPPPGNPPPGGPPPGGAPPPGSPPPAGGAPPPRPDEPPGPPVPGDQPPPGGRGRVVAKPPTPGGVETSDQKMDRFAQTPGYEWLKGRGYLWDEYTHDMTFRQSQAKTPQELAAWQNVDFLDWLNNQGAQGNMNPLAGRRGEDTFNAANDPRYSRGGWDNSASQGEGIGFGVNPDTGQPFHSADEQNQWHWANYTVDGRRKTPLPGQQATPAAPAPTAAPQAGPSPAAPPPPPYSDRPMPSMPFFPGQGPTGIMTTGSQSATTGGAPPGGPPTDSVSSLYDPLFRQQQEELARTLRGQAALDNSINSGGFNESLGRQEANLIGQQGAQKAQAIQQQQQLLMQKYGIDQQTANNMMSLQTQAGMQKYTADLGAEVQRLGITTNADLARLADSTQRYGIGINDLLQRYQAELQLKGVQYSADKGVDAAALHAAASSAAATAGAAAQKYSTDVGRQNLLSQLGERAWEAGNENNLGWGNLQAGLYNSDANRQLDWARLAQSQGLSPADIANILRGFAPTAPIPVTTGGR